MQKSIQQFIAKLPKAELHLHIEGSFEPELMFKLADKNKIKLKYNSIEELKAAYNFNNLQEFLDIYYEGANVLITEDDFYDLTMDYFNKINSENVIHTEIMFDPQTHTNRGIPFATVISGIKNAQIDAEKEFGITSKLILNFLRHLDEKSAFKTLEESLEYREWICAIGLDSSELGNPPSKFERVFEEARKEGFLPIAHAGEEAPAGYIWEAIDTLQVKRIDHGIRAIDDERLIERLVNDHIPLTVCPLSNVKLKNVKSIEDHPIKYMLNKNLLVTINSDDPAYFGGYMNKNYEAVTHALDFTMNDLIQLTKNSFRASFLGDQEKLEMEKRVDEFYRLYTSTLS